MEDKNTDKEYELKAHLQELERQRDALEENEKKTWQREDDADMGLTMAHRALEQMELGCSPRDNLILGLMEEKQQAMYAMRKKRTEFLTELEDETKRKKQQIDWEMEDTHMELCSMETQEEEEPFDTEERGRESSYDRE